MNRPEPIRNHKQPIRNHQEPTRNQQKSHKSQPKPINIRVLGAILGFQVLIWSPAYLRTLIVMISPGHDDESSN